MSDKSFSAAVAEARFAQRYPDGLQSTDDAELRREAYTDLCSWGVPPARAMELSCYRADCVRTRTNAKRRERGRLEPLPELSAAFACPDASSTKPGMQLRKLDRMKHVTKPSEVDEEWALAQLLVMYNWYAGKSAFIEAMSVWDRIANLKGWLRTRRPAETPVSDGGLEPAEEIVRQLAAQTQRPTVLLDTPRRKGNGKTGNIAGVLELLDNEPIIQ